MTRGRSEISRRLGALEARGYVPRECVSEVTPEQAARVYELFLEAESDPEHPYDGPDVHGMSPASAMRI